MSKVSDAMGRFRGAMHLWADAREEWKAVHVGGKPDYLDVDSVYINTQDRLTDALAEVVRAIIEEER